MAKDESLAVRLGKRLRFHRRIRDRSQEALAHRMGCGRSYVSVLERGDVRTSVEVFVRYCRALGIDPADVLREVLRDDPAVTEDVP